MLRKYLFIYLMLLSSGLLGLTSSSFAQELDFPSLQSPPPVNETQLLVWANEAIVTVFGFNYANYREQLQAASRYFVPEAWEVYTTVLAEAGLLDTVKKKQYSVGAVATGLPIITEQKHSQGRHLWDVEMPVLVVYQNENNQREQNLLIKLTITATSETLGTRGLGILKFESEPIADI